jgi:excisionase family DNA binding protein
MSSPAGSNNVIDPHSVDLLAVAAVDSLVERIAQRVAALLANQAHQQAAPVSPWLDVDAACAYLAFSRDQLYKLTAARAIPCHKKANGQGLRFHRDELDAWMETRYPRLDRLG